MLGIGDGALVWADSKFTSTCAYHSLLMCTYDVDDWAAGTPSVVQVAEAVG